jgi:hypothetical protein
MWSKNHKAKTSREEAHIVAVKSLPCSVCDAPPPSDAHHIKQDSHFSCVALCKDCHQNGRLGWHGERRMWAIKKMDEHDALYVTLQRLMEQRA